ncbi:cysteine--tRNA ligase [Candidatus Geothermarchaeota archaeon ex4572_27]|nr:MAG: cysteine--tRNA ligase [Candidatus Geothermarchaeota archaeon ex4572_27]
MGALRIYNTLTGRKEEFKPIEEGVVRIYVCGPTVYDHCHLGHFKTFVFFDFLVRYLRFKGYRVEYVMNITDVDDKIIARASQEGVDIKEYAERYIRSFLEDMRALRLVRPTHMPRATEHIEDMIRLIRRLIEKGYAYVSDGNVYFSVEKFRDYGKLSKVDKEKVVGEAGEGKRSPLDFALWKAWKPGEPWWDSPWGRGRPGWHIECSAMSMKYLGETFDIHGGGSDLIFPHHENEIAQSEAATGKQFVRYWMHVGTLNLRQEKMSKSIGNVILIKEVLKRYPPDVVRLYYFSIHYRRPQELDMSVFDEVSRMYERIRRTYRALLEEYRGAPEDEGARRVDEVMGFLSEFLEAMDDDLNTPRALSAFMRFVRWLNEYLEGGRVDKRTLAAAIYFYDVFREVSGVLEEEGAAGPSGVLRELIDLIVEVRGRLRERKMYDLSDYIRERLRELGIILEDRGRETRVRFEAPAS